MSELDLDLGLTILLGVISFWAIGSFLITIMTVNEYRLRPSLKEVFIITLGLMFRVISMERVDEWISESTLDRLVKERIERREK